MDQPVTSLLTNATLDVLGITKMRFFCVRLAPQSRTSEKIFDSSESGHGSLKLTWGDAGKSRSAASRSQRAIRGNSSGSPSLSALEVFARPAILELGRLACRCRNGAHGEADPIPVAALVLTGQDESSRALGTMEVDDGGAEMRIILYYNRVGRTGIKNEIYDNTEQRAAQVPASATVLLGPATQAEYGLNLWRYCSSPFGEEEALGPVEGLWALADPACDDVFLLGHGGKGGYVPFMDAEGRYGAVLAIREDSPGAGDQYADEQLALSARVQMLVHLAMVE